MAKHGKPLVPVKIGHDQEHAAATLFSYLVELQQQRPAVFDSLMRRLVEANLVRAPKAYLP